MSTTALWVLIFVLLVWGGGYWAPGSPVRGNNLLHLLLVALLVYLVVQLLGGGGFRLHRL
jgi:hypothetical protein